MTHLTSPAKLLLLIGAALPDRFVLAGDGIHSVPVLNVVTTQPLPHLLVGLGCVGMLFLGLRGRRQS